MLLGSASEVLEVGWLSRRLHVQLLHQETFVCILICCGELGLLFAQSVVQHLDLRNVLPKRADSWSNKPIVKGGDLHIRFLILFPATFLLFLQQRLNLLLTRHQEFLVLFYGAG